jgi:HlyD family secretion protein
MNTFADPLVSIRNYLRVGLVLALLLGGGVGGWTAVTEISGAVIAAGQVAVESNTKKIQHPQGGIVGLLNVKEGSAVKAGEIVLRLDDTLAAANRSIAESTLTELTARQARLIAERDDEASIIWPLSLEIHRDVPEVARVVAGEERLFTFRRAARLGQKSQLRERIQQARAQVGGLEEQLASKLKELDFIARELDGLRDLYKKKLVPLSRVNALERDAVRIQGEHGQLFSTAAATKGKISEIDLQIIQIDQDMRSEVAKDLQDTRAKIAEAIERKVTADDHLKRIDIRAPQDGIVHQLVVHTIGGVIGAGEVIMQIVPTKDTLVVEARIDPQSIDQVHAGQPAIYRFTAFNQRTTPELNGEVILVSADAERDERSGRSFYTVRLSLPPEEIRRLGDVKLVPGMPVEIFIKIGDRTVLSYLVKPISDQIMHAFREK